MSCGARGVSGTNHASIFHMGRVAIVDDSEDALELFEFILRGDHTFLTYSSSERFLQEFERGAFDLVLLDLVMPGMDGFGVFDHIREQDSDVPVVAITAQAFPRERERALAA